MSVSPLVVSLVERGWQAARETSLRTRDERRWWHVIKGALPNDVRRLIAPYPSIRLLSVPKKLYWPAAWGVCLLARLRGPVEAVVVDNARAVGRLKLLTGLMRVPVVPVEQWDAACPRL